jgi:hypothetical protein
MNVGSRHFTMRHLIMGLGRVQESRHVKILSPSKEKAHIVPVARLAFQAYAAMAKESQKQELEIKTILEAANKAVDADMGSEAGELDDASSDLECVVGDPFADVEFD